MWRTIKIIFAVLVLIGLGFGAYKVDKFLAALKIDLPEYQATKKTVWLDQNISKDKLSWFYHADQGTRTFSLEARVDNTCVAPTLARLMGLPPPANATGRSLV